LGGGSHQISTRIDSETKGNRITLISRQIWATLASLAPRAGDQLDEKPCSGNPTQQRLADPEQMDGDRQQSVSVQPKQAVVERGV
jgi:hypothetical protein